MIIVIAALNGCGPIQVTNINRLNIQKFINYNHPQVSGLWHWLYLVMGGSTVNLQKKHQETLVSTRKSWGCPKSIPPGVPPSATQWSRAAALTTGTVSIQKDTYIYILHLCLNYIILRRLSLILACRIKHCTLTSGDNGKPLWLKWWALDLLSALRFYHFFMIQH